MLNRIILFRKKKLSKNKYSKRATTQNFNAGGGLSSSPKDYGKFLICMLNKGKVSGVEILKEEILILENDIVRLIKEVK